MFLADLGDKEKNAFLQLAHHMVTADGTVTIDEVEMLNDAVEEMDLPKGSYESDPVADITECCSAVETRRAQVMILLELASFAYVDLEYHLNERDFFRTVAETWGIDDLTVVRIEEWARCRVELACDAAEIIHEAEIYRAL